MTKLRRTAVGWLLGLGLVRCTALPATEVIVRIAADPELRARGALLHVEVFSQEGDRVLDRQKALAGSEPELARVPVVPRDGDASRYFTVRAELFDAAGASLGVERITSGYREDRLSEVLLVFHADCAAAGDCGEGRRCRSGVCVGDCVDPVEHAERETPSRCVACDRCVANRCEPLEDGTACGCDGDQCVAGSCVVARPVRSVALGLRHTCALTVDGAAYCWGDDDLGQLGLENGGANVPVPTFVLSLPVFWRGLHAESHTTCALGGDEVRRCWGENTSGQFGDGTTGPGSAVPVRIDTPPVRDLSAGGAHFCGLDAAGTLWCWGYDAHGQVGNGVASQAEPTPAKVPLSGPIRFADAGGLHTCAIGQDDSLWCWGYNDSGQIGVGDLTDRTEPVRPGCQSGQEACFHDWQTVSLGSFTTCGIRKGGSLWCWGGNTNAQLGVGTIGTNEPSPLAVDGDATYTTVACGYQHTCAIRDDGTLWCWGNGDSGQLGNGGRERRSVPTEVTPPDAAGRWEEVYTSAGGGAEGGAHTCAIRNDRTLWCWGRNGSGQVGVGRGSDEPVVEPRRVCLPRE